MAGHELMSGLAVVMFLVTLGKHVFLLGLQHGKLANFIEITIETALTGGNRRQ